MSLCLSSTKEVMALSVISLLFMAFFCKAYTDQHSAYFEEISTSHAHDDDTDDDGEFATSSLIHGSFHRCSVSEEDCNFVIKDKTKNEYRLIENQKDLPEMQARYRIWEKMFSFKAKVAGVKSEEKGKDHYFYFEYHGFKFARREIGITLFLLMFCFLHR